MSLYIRLSTQALTDAKLVAVGSDGFTLWIKGLLYAKEHLTDGFVPEAAIPMLTIGIRRAKETVSKLLEGGNHALWFRVEGGYTVGAERWANWQTTKDEVEEKREADRKRMAEWRKSKKNKANDNDVTNLSRSNSDSDMSQCHKNVTPTEHRAQSTEHRAQETKGHTASPVTPTPPRRSTGANGEFMLAVGLLQELRLASTTSDIGVVAQVINLEAPEHGGEVEAAEFIKQRATEAQKRGEHVTVFWLKDRKFTQENGNGTNQRNTVSPAHERICRTRRALADTLTRRGIDPTRFIALANGGPIPEPRPVGLSGGVSLGLRAAGPALLDEGSDPIPR